MCLIDSGTYFEKFLNFDNYIYMYTSIQIQMQGKLPNSSTTWEYMYYIFILKDDLTFSEVVDLSTMLGR